MVYFGWYLVNPHIQGIQNMYGKGGQGVLKAKLRAAEVDPRFNICRVVKLAITDQSHSANFRPRSEIEST